MTDKALIRRVRFAPGRDPHAARARLERALDRAEWGVPALPPAAILCVRRLRVLSCAPGAISAALASLARSAARPAREFVPAAAEAVWFADDAERLACFARAALTGEVAAQWWWGGVRGDTTPVRSALREWLAAPAATPAAWRLLAGWGHARSFATALEPSEAAALTHRTQIAFGVHPHPVAAREPIAPADVVRIVPEAHTLPPGPQRAALVLGLLLARAPHLARTGASAVQLLARVERETAPGAQSETPDGRPAPQIRVRPAPRAGGTPALERVEGSLARAHPPAPGGPGAVSVHEPGPAPRGAESEQTGASAPADESPTALIRSPSSEVRPAPVDLGEGSEVVAGSDRSATEAHPTERPVGGGPRPTVEVPQPAERVLVPERIETEFGGLLYLVNVALALHLYPDFTEPTRSAIPLSLWDWLALLGRRWLGRLFLDDPLDGLLAALAGRQAGSEPGAGDDPPRDWRLPDPWRPWAGIPAPETWSGLADWIAWLAPVVAERLASALGGTDVDEAPRRLLQRRAAILVAPAHLDVMFPLADLDVEIRISGLDRDPGWLPASGVTVRFHYESHGAASERLR